MKKSFLSSFCVSLTVICFVFLGLPNVQSQEKVKVDREERASVNAGFMMGGGMAGCDLEFLLNRRIGLQVGAGFVGASASINYHLRPYINSSFFSVQYMHVGFGGGNVGATVGPMFNFRARKLFQAGIGWGAVVSRGPLWEDAYKKDVSLLLNFNVGLYIPF